MGQKYDWEDKLEFTKKVEFELCLNLKLDN